ncbi:MAG: hypothetical protein ACLRQX_04430 [Turicibacter sanguinis]
MQSTSEVSGNENRCKQCGDTYTSSVTCESVISLPNTEIRLEIGRPQSIEALEVCEEYSNYVILVLKLIQMWKFRKVKIYSNTEQLPR